MAAETGAVLLGHRQFDAGARRGLSRAKQRRWGGWVGEVGKPWARVTISLQRRGRECEGLLLD